MNPIWNLITDGTLSQKQIQLLDQYLDLLIAKNEVINLTRITDRTDAEIRHIADALTLLKYFPKKSGMKLADVGTGGGILGITIAIARPDIQVVLIDSTRKKLEAVMEMSDTLGLKNTRAVHVRMEEIRERFDFITARGVAELGKLLGWCGHMMTKFSVLLALKGPKISEELQKLSSSQRRQWDIQVSKIELPELAGHCIVECMTKSNH